MAASSPILSLILLFHTLLLAFIVPATTKQPIFSKNNMNFGFRYGYGYPPKINSPPAAHVAPIKAQVTGSGDEYVMSLAIGTPPVTISLMLDTGSDLIWTKCTTGLFNPSMSTSFFQLTQSCSEFGLDPDCIKKYENGISIRLTLGQETLTFGGNNNIPDVNFACGEPDGENFKYDGILGMGRGDLSLVSQLKESVFLYCLGDRFGPQTMGLFLMGSEARIKNTNTQTTSLLKQETNSYYYISLEGISVGETRLAVTASDFAMDSNGNGGMIIDSGSTFTYLEEHVVDMISDEFVNQTKVEKCEDHKPFNDLEHCFRPVPGAAYDFPKLVFHFVDADWELLRENYIYEVKGENMSCLAFIANKGNDRMSVFGNMQQQNMMMIYDLEYGMLSFKRADCNRL